MTFRKFYIAIAALLLIPVSMSGTPQRRLRGLYNNSDTKIVRRYADSLLLFRDSLYRDSVHATAVKPIDVAPYFLPFTFYEGVTDNAFSLNKKLSETDSTLLSLGSSRMGREHTTTIGNHRAYHPTENSEGKSYGSH